MASLKGWTMPDKAVFGKYGAGSSSDRTNFESTVVLKRDGVKQSSALETPTDGGKIINFIDVSKGDIIEWEAKTLCDGDPTRDRINVILTYYDPIYIGKLTNQILEKMTDADFVSVMRGDSEVIGKYLEDDLDIDQAIKQVYSTTVITDSEGIAAGQIPLSENYPYADYVLTIHYGYSGLAERSTSDKAYEFWTEEVGLFVVEVGLLVLASYLSLGLATAALVGAWVAGAADIAIAASNYMASGFGAIDENRKGCLFPAMGWNHTYNFILDEPVEVENKETGEPEESTEITQAIVSQFTPETLSRIKALQTEYGFGGISTGAFLGIIGLFVLVAGTIVFGRKRRVKKK